VSKKTLLITVSACALALAARADDTGKVFSLGTVTVSAALPDQPEMGGSLITSEQTQLFDRDTLDTALTLAPGVSTSLSGPRDEVDVRIRGFGGSGGKTAGSSQIPLYLDGIPIYLPYDDGINYARFTSSDVSEIQLTKSYTSVIAGPNAIGGSINLVSRQVTKPFEGDARLTTSFDQNGAFNGVVADVFAGAKLGNWYVQVSATENDRTHFRLSDGFTPGPYQNSGNREDSGHQDTKVNVKVGYTPNNTDEYSLNIIDLEGAMKTPLPDSSNLPTNMACGLFNKFGLHCWDWGDWDNRSVFWLSKTALDDAGSYIKTRVYYEQFYNAINFDSNLAETQMVSATPTTGLEKSIYDDRALGGSAEVSQIFLGGLDDVMGAFHFRRDEHYNQNIYPFTSIGSYTQPWIHDSENTYSVALQNTLHPLPNWDVTAGVSYDYRQTISADNFNLSSALSSTSKTAAAVAAANPGSWVYYPVADKHAVNPQILVADHYSDSGAAHASVSQRTRFPDFAEMYSNGLLPANLVGTISAANPNLQPEKAVIWEAGVSDTIDHVHLGANLFYTRNMNAINPAIILHTSTVTVTENENAGAEVHEGFEFEASAPLSSNLEVGGNYTFLIRKITDPGSMSTPTTILTDTAKHHGFVYADWAPFPDLHVVPSVELNGKEWFTSANPLYSSSYYFRGGDFALVNLKVGYQVATDVVVEAGVKNLFDENYSIEDGYNGEGRNLFATVRVRF
jgi:iron complex outermembrane receptor protein